MLALLCHVSPRSIELAACLNDRQLGPIGERVDAQAWSFEQILSIGNADLRTQLMLELQSASAPKSSVWVAVSPSAASLLIANIKEYAPTLRGLPAHMSLIGMGAGTQEVLDDSRLLGQGPSQMRLRSQVLNDSQAAPDARRMLHIVREHAELFPDALSIRVVKGEGGREDWISHLRELQFDVLEFSVYRRASMPTSVAVGARLWQACLGNEHVALVLPSAAAVASVLAYQPKELSQASCPVGASFWRDWLLRQSCLLPHPRLQAMCLQMGFTCTQVYRSGTAGLLDALKSTSEHN